VVRLNAASSKRILPFDGVDRLTAEQYRILRTNILRSAAPHSALCVTSVSPGDGKTTTSVNLAGVLALKNDLHVLLVDADLRRRGVASMLGIQQAPGLAEVLTGQCTLDNAIVQTANLPNLWILPSGGTTSSPAELLDSPAWTQLVASLRAEFSFVVIDTTPIGVVTDYALVEKVCEHTILVVRPDHTARKGCEEALDKLQQEKFLGVVLNGIQEWFLGSSPDRYHYY
jgi:capsular exopolysaccharide synthesis family protein